MSFTPLIDPENKARYPDFHLISIVVRNAEIDVPDAQALTTRLRRRNRRRFAMTPKGTRILRVGRCLRGFRHKGQSNAVLGRRASQAGAERWLSPADIPTG
ncbi:hypothetical protein [Mesorhizobium sp. M1163]|uniref:hypothetical protein n=1 Tax=Mesorhizobium sp. M1163 TaxID=2957065 RepID=UPI00333BA400